MRKNAFSSLAEQVAAKILSKLESGVWAEKMPGNKALANEFGVNHKTTEAALKQLESQGVLKSQGRGRTRKILLTQTPKKKSLSIVILLYNKAATRDPLMVELIHQLRQAGHEAVYAQQTLQGMQMNPTRISRYVSKTKADAWIVLAASKAVLDWFAAQDFPSLALFGRINRNRSMASIGLWKLDATRELIHRLIRLGHKRIVMIAGEDRRLPEPGIYERGVLQILEEEGIQTSTYNLPNWGRQPEELQRTMTSLFKITPPTALLVEEPTLFLPILQALTRLGASAPERVSLACLDHSHTFQFACPAITHLAWDQAPLIKAVKRWVHQVGLGKRDIRNTTIKARLALGETIGPSPI